MESIFMALSIGSAILSMVLVFISFILPKERVVVHTIIVSIFLILFKIALIIAILVMEIHLIFRIIVIVNSVTLMALWGFILWTSIIRLRELTKDKNG